MAKMMRPEAEVTRFGEGIDVIATSGANNPGPMTLSYFNDTEPGNGRVEYMGKPYYNMQDVLEATGASDIIFAPSKEVLDEGGQLSLSDIFVVDEMGAKQPYNGDHLWYKTENNIMYYYTKN